LVSRFAGRWPIIPGTARYQSRVVIPGNLFPTLLSN
jgi:hypothetical protein